MDIKVLHIKISPPTAHYRMPFTYQRRHTYPIPPYSTVLGMIINLLGIYNQNNDLFKKLKNCKLSVSGRFDIKHTEYIWFRNLSKTSHKKYFGSETIREKNGETEHIGGQSPMRIDILENMKLNIHIYSEDNEFLETLYQAFLNPVNRSGIIHLGRAEDWVLFEDIRYVELKQKVLDKNYDNFFWIPQKTWGVNPNGNKIDGLLYNMPVFSTIKDYDKTFDRNGMRTFNYLRVKLNDGAIRGTNYLFDGKLPVFLADLSQAK